MEVYRNWEKVQRQFGKVNYYINIRTFFNKMSFSREKKRKMINTIKLNYSIFFLCGTTCEILILYGEKGQRLVEEY